MKQTLFTELKISMIDNGFYVKNEYLVSFIGLKNTKMKRSHKLLLLFLTLLPVLMLPVLIFWIIGGGMQIENMDNPDSATPFFVGGMMIWILLIGLISTIVFIYYLIHVIRNKQIEQNEKILWVVLFLFIGFISHLVYFYMRIWKEPENQLANKQADQLY